MNPTIRPTTASLVSQLNALLVTGCTALTPIKSLPGSAVFGMQKAQGADSFTVLFTDACAYVAHDHLGLFRVRKGATVQPTATL